MISYGFATVFVSTLLLLTVHYIYVTLPLIGKVVVVVLVVVVGCTVVVVAVTVVDGLIVVVVVGTGSNVIISKLLFDISYGPIPFKR